MIIEVNDEEFLLNLGLINTDFVNFEFKNNPYKKYLLYVNNKNILGFLCYEDIFDRYEIDNIYVIESNRRKGIGKLLLERLILLGNTNKIKNITLEVSEKNIPALKLYIKEGFEKKAIRKGYYNGIDGILMEKEMI